MLQKTAVSDNILNLIQELQKDDELQNFVLAGGTALALQIGHRKSEDIDLFTRQEFDASSLLEYLERNYGFKMNFQAASTLKEFSFGEIVGIFEKKYNTRNNSHAVKSLTWFEDVDLNDWPVIIREPNLTFNKVKREIIKQRNIFLKAEGIL